MNRILYLFIFLLTAVSAKCIINEQPYKQLSNLPAIYIETANSQPITSKEVYTDATLYWVDKAGITTYTDATIRGRGNSTWGLAKKPYRIKFKKKKKFLGDDRANAKSWTLLANHTDKALMRNAVAACIGDFAGQPFTAAAVFVDLVLNGEYLGNYQVSDQMEVREKRVEITEQEEGATEDSNITGGYFLEVDGFATSEPVYFQTSKGILVTIKSPDDDVINTAQRKYISSHMQKFEDALFSSNFTDPDKGYRQYVDSLTLASWYISSELTANPDAFWSTYMYKEKDDDRFFFGPLWDYDIAFNNCSRTGDLTRALLVEKGLGASLARIWMQQMWKDPWFLNLVNREWKKCVKRGMEDYVIAFVDSLAEELEQSQRLNFAKWPLDKKVYDEYMLFSTYSEGIDFLKTFIHNRFAYLTETFAKAAGDTGSSGPDPEPAKLFKADPMWNYRIYNKGTGGAVDVNNNSICIWQHDDSRATQNWELRGLENGAYLIVNTDSHLAIVDMAQKDGNSYLTGTQLALAQADSTDVSQQWFIRETLSGKSYVIVNCLTDLAWNNAGADSTNGTRVISWTNDSQNDSKTTRQWVLEQSTPSDYAAIAPAIGSDDCYASYNPHSQTLHFGAYSDIEITGHGSIYAPSGNLLMQFDVAPEISIASLPSGILILNVEINGKSRAVKFCK